MDLSNFVEAMKRYDLGERPYRFITPVWFIRTEDGRTYPLKYVYAMAVGIAPIKLHTSDAKHAAAEAGVQFFKLGSELRSDLKPRFWWVNHKQTFKAEAEGGYIWSPKESKSGATNQTYKNLANTCPGDIVISFAFAEIRAIGVVMSDHREHSKPEAFGGSGQNWSNIGWLVPIEWTFLKFPISPKSHIGQIGPLLPKKNSPLQSNGNGNQGCYLAAISEELGQFVLEQASANQPIKEYLEALRRQAMDDLAQEHIQNSATMSDTIKEQLVKSRRGQGVFRARVLKQEKSCRMTKISDPAFLVASHIKPWCRATNEERLDGANGLMLAPHVDRLFDKGLITFEDDGSVIVSGQAENLIKAWGLEGVYNVGPFTSKQCKYMKYHRASVYGNPPK